MKSDTVAQITARRLESEQVENRKEMFSGTKVINDTRDGESSFFTHIFKPSQ